MRHKVIGIVGGMGPQAGVALHEAIIRHTPAAQDQDHLSVVLMTFPGEITDRTAYLEGNTSTNPAEGILRVINKLVAVGAEVIGFPCNTSYAPEIYQPIVQAINDQYPGIQLIHLPTAVINHLDGQSQAKRVGLMATNGTYQSNIYQELLQLHGYEIVLPKPEYQEAVVHKMIYDSEFGIKANSIDISREAVALWHQALGFFKAQQVDKVILGCTELSLIHKQHPAMGLEIIDTTEVLARALIHEAMSPKMEQQKIFG